MFVFYKYFLLHFCSLWRFKFLFNIFNQKFSKYVTLSVFINFGSSWSDIYFKITQNMRWHQKYWLALITPSFTLTTPLAAKVFSNKLAANVPNNMPSNPTFFSFASFSIALLTPHCFTDNCKLDSQSYLIIFISFISLFQIISVVIRDP